MNTTAIKAVIDTNVLVAIIGKKSPFRWIFDCMIQGKIRLCISNEILTEYQEVLELKNRAEVAENVINFILVSPYTERTDIYFNFLLINQDEDDNKYVDCAISKSADCIITNDGHFQVLKQIEFPSIEVLTVLEFELKYKNQLMN
jgi:putative PIN family toxin of toxin-antitoxin system